MEDKGKEPSRKENSRPRGLLLADSTDRLQRKLTPVLHRLVQNTEQEGAVSHLLDEVGTTPTPTPTPGRRDKNT